MKLENKKVKVLGQEITYFQLIAQCLEATALEGVTIGQMRDKMKVLDKLEEEKVEIIEDELEKIILPAVNGMKWSIINQELISFGDYLNNLLGDVEKK